MPTHSLTIYMYALVSYLPLTHQHIAFRSVENLYCIYNTTTTQVASLTICDVTVTWYRRRVTPQPP